MTEKAVEMSNDIEELQIDVRTVICQLGETSHCKLCAGLQVEVKETDKGRLTLIQLLMKYLDAEEIGIEALTKLKAAIKEEEKKPVVTETEKESDVVKPVKLEHEEKKPAVERSAKISTLKESPAIPLFRKEFKISGQIGDLRQKDRLSFTSLAHQIDAGLSRGYKEEEIVEAVIRAINPGLRLRSYLEGKLDLELARLRKILRSHYQEKGATEVYQLLSSAVQEAGETPQDFLIRLLDLKQKVLFVSQESGSDLKYDPKLVQCMFLHSLLTGLRNDSIKMEIKPSLQNTQVKDEEFFEKLNAAVSNETERMQKLSFRHVQSTIRDPAQLVVKVTTPNENRTPIEDKTPEKPPKVNLLTEVRELKAELAAIREGIEKRSSTSPHLQYNPVEQGRVPPRGCWNCERQGRSAHCNHCFNCGGVGHFRYQCLRPSRSFNPTNFPGNKPGLPPWDREQPLIPTNSPNNV